jgi:hypothetical protein
MVFARTAGMGHSRSILSANVSGRYGVELPRSRATPGRSGKSALKRHPHAAADGQLPTGKGGAFRRSCAFLEVWAAGGSTVAPSLTH